MTDLGRITQLIKTNCLLVLLNQSDEIEPVSSPEQVENRGQAVFCSTGPVPINPGLITSTDSMAELAT